MLNNILTFYSAIILFIATFCCARLSRNRNFRRNWDEKLENEIQIILDTVPRPSYQLERITCEDFILEHESLNY